jgi:hypothetical protein
MRPRTDKPLDFIGAHLREAWSDVATAPLPENLRCLVEALSKPQKTQPQASAGPFDRQAHSRARE